MNAFPTSYAAKCHPNLALKQANSLLLWFDTQLAYKSILPPPSGVYLLPKTTKRLLNVPSRFLLISTTQGVAGSFPKRHSIISS